MSADIRLITPVVLPAPDRRAAPTPTATLVVERPLFFAGPARPLDRPVILVVDDDPDTRAVLACMLEGAGLAVLEAPDGNSALYLAQTTPLSAVVLDVVLPDRSGFDVCRRLRGQLDRTVPVVLMTALPSIMDETAWSLAGADACLTKPVRRRDLLPHLTR